MTTNYVQVVLGRLCEHHATSGLDADLLHLYALLALTKGGDTSLQDVHDAWALWRNTTAPDHRSLVPFAELTAAVQELDRPYMEAIHWAAAGAGAT